MHPTRRRILDASIALVAERGVRAVSFREVARRADVSHQAPYHHFGNHQAILRAIAAEGFDKLASAMRSAADGAGDPHAAVVEMGRAYVAFALRHPGHFRVMFDQTLIESEQQEPLEEATKTYATLVDVTARSHAAGAAPHLEPQVLAHLCWSTVHGLATLSAEGVLPYKAGPGAADPVILALASLLNPTTAG